MSPDCMSGKHDSKIWPWHTQRPKVIKSCSALKKDWNRSSKNWDPHCTQRSLAFAWSCHGPVRLNPMQTPRMDTIVKFWVHVYRYPQYKIYSSYIALDFISISGNHSTLWSDGFVWLLGRHHHILFAHFEVVPWPCHTVILTYCRSLSLSYNIIVQ